MSTFTTYELTCRCGTTTTVELAQGIHITRLPESRRQILEGRFQVFTCPSCGEDTGVEAPTIYTDFARNEYIAVETSVRGELTEAVQRHQQVFDDAFLHGPSIASEMGVRFRKRLVCGFAAMREKLILWDAALDDLVVEAVKGDLLDELDVAPSEAVLRLATVLDGGHLLFARLAPVEASSGSIGERRWSPAPPEDFVTAPATRYVDRLRSRASIAEDYPWLAADWLVDLHHGLELSRR